MNEFAQSLTSMVWAMEPRALQRLIAEVAAVTQAQIDHTVRAIGEKGDLLERLHARDGNQAKNTRRRAADFREKDLDIRNGVAHVAIEGPMMKQVPSIFNWLGIKATSTEAVRAELETAILSDRVEAIVLDIDSPGGTVDGTAALAADIFATRGMKPITARVDDLMASAALWVGSQAERIEAGPSAAVGSLGVYAVVDDKSRHFENKGIKTHVVSSGELKGAFVEGSQVTETQLEDLRRNINTYTDLFVEAVARGREMSDEKARELATGQMWIGTEAMDRGLVDLVEAGDGLNAMSTGPAPESTADESTKDQKKKKSEAVDYGRAVHIPRAELKITQVTNAAKAAAQSGSNPRMESQMTPEERAEMDRLRADNAALKTKADEAKVKADTAEAEAEQARVRLEVEQEQKKEALLNQYADRIPPAARGSVAELFKTMTPDQAEAYLKDLPQITRPDRETTAEDVVEGAYELAQHGGPMTIEERSLGKSFGQSAERVRDMVALGASVERVEYERVEDAEGRIVMKPLAIMNDGRRLDRNELKKALGLKGALASIVFLLCSVLAGDAMAAALTDARATQCRLSGITKRYLMEASDTIYRGSLVMIDTDGEVVPAAAEANNNNVAGVAQETKTAAASGSTWIRVSDGVICKFAGTTLGQDDVGSAVYAEDDQTVDETVGSNEPVAGVLVEYISASEAWIYVSSLVNFGRVNVSQPITLTDVLTLEEAATIGQAVDTEIEFTEASEDFSFDFKTNEIELSSDTGVVAFDLAAVGTTLGLNNGVTIVTDTDEEIQFGDSEDVSMYFGTSNSLDWSSDTGVVTIDFAAVGTTITLANDQYIVSDENNYIKLGDGTEDIEFGFGNANTVDFTSDSGVTDWDFAATGSKMIFENDQILEFDEDNVVKIGDAEDIEFGFGTSNTVIITSDSGVTKIDFDTMNLETDGTFQILGSGATIGWTIANSANQACSTTCAGTGSAVIGIDSATHLFVLPNDATADGCVCAGPAS